MFAKQLIVFCIAIGAAGIASSAEAQVASTRAGASSTATADAASDPMEQVFTKYPEKFTPEIIAAYRRKQIVVGMDPYLAARAGGAYTYDVQADQRWPQGTDPQRVIYAQATHPDDSHIRMTFMNATQFPDAGPTRFAVVVEHGRVTRIDKVAAPATAPATAADGLPEPGDIDYAWDEFNHQGRMIWACRGVQSGTFVPPELCAFKPKIDSQWPDKKVPGNWKE
jgi:hypothetical protein